MPKRVGRKSAAQTPAPKSDIKYGSKVNKVGSASASESKNIQLSEKTLNTLKEKLAEFKKKHPNNKTITLSDLKAVYRRGSGAYSKSHRPTITGGAPNTRAAWSFARVNKFLLKAGGTKVKAAYVQDDDLMEDGGVISWQDYQKTQFDEDVNRYLPSDYFEKFEIKEVNKGDYPNLLKKINGLEFREWKYGGIGVFDGNKKVAFADNGSIQVAEEYQKRGIGLELVTLLKEMNPNHKFGNMTPQGRSLMRSYYDKKIANKMEDGGLIAPNSKPSNLTPEQYKLVRTPEFKSWFGDWENDPQNASKVVDENGEPMVVYHGSNKKLFTQFKNYFERKKIEIPNDRIKLHFFTNDRNAAKDYGKKNIYECFLSMKNPLYYKFSDGTPEQAIFQQKKDGFILKSNPSIFGVPKSNQIKLADGTNTTFDIDNQDIRYKDGGKLFNDKELLAKWKKGESIGFTGVAHLKAKGLIPRADGTKRKSEKYMEHGGEVKISNEDYDFFVGGDEYFGKAIKQNEVTVGGIEYDEDEIKGIEIKNKFRKKGLAKKAVKALFEKNPSFKSVYVRAVPKAKAFWEKIGTKFDNYNQDAGLWEGTLKKYEHGGEIGQDVVCKNCGWEWNTVDSDEKDKYVCHKCGFDNTLFYSDDIFARGGKTKGGDCYVKAGSFCLLPNMHEFIGEPYLVHAEVRGQGKIEGLRYGHAWVEDDENVYDYSNGREIVMPKQVYYLLGDIKTDNPKKYQKYSFPEARAKMLKTKHYGSWDIETDYADGGLIAPNGKESNLTPEQYKLVRTPEFKAWFGDWENDPQNASKVLDENGEPLVVYHGTQNVWWDKNFVFNPQFEGKSTNVIRRKFGAIYFTSNKDVASTYGVNIIPVFLNFRNPLIIDANNKNIFDIYELEKIDYNDDAIVKNTNDSGQFGFGMSYSLISDIYVTTKIFGAIKIADGTNTTFDVNNPDIRFENGGEMEKYKAKTKKFEKGGEFNPDDKKTKDMITHKSGSAGGMLVGNRHSEGGIKAINKASNTPLEMEGGEVVITRNAVSDDKKHEFEGEMLTNREILSKINESGGGVSFAKGGDIMSKFKKPMSIKEIQDEYGVDSQYLENQLEIGTKHELEHTNDKEIAKIIALHHLAEKPNYYELVEKYKLEQGGQPSKFWHKSEKETYEIPDFIKKERMATEELLCSSDTRIAKAIICRAKIDFCIKKEANTRNLEEKNAWSEVKHIWESCLQEIKKGVVYEYKDGGECGCASSKKYKNGGLAYGNSHDKGGMPLKVQSTGQSIEIEGGEGVVNKRSMQIKKRIDFEGKKLTPCQIVSKINQMGGGVKFKCDDVAEILEKDGSF